MKILLIEDTTFEREHYKNIIERAGNEIIDYSNAEDVLALSSADIMQFDLAIIDMRLPGMDGLQAGKVLRQKNQFLDLIMLTAFPDVNTAKQALRNFGFNDFVQKKDGDETLLKTILEISKNRIDYPPDELFIGSSPSFKMAVEKANRVAPTDVSVLLLGERGTGKELMAKYIHKNSNRNANPLVSVDCGALTESMEGDELFGHNKSSFTGAATERAGLFRSAEKGTLFFDEIGNMPTTLQKKLERALQERKIKPLGEDSEITVDVRMIYATNKDLAKLIEERKFLQDLFDRINVVTIEIPPLRDRPEDIRLLVNYFLQKYSSKYKGSAKALSLDKEAYRMLEIFNWPGNVRQLENVIINSVVLIRPGSKVIYSEDLNLSTTTQTNTKNNIARNYNFDKAEKQLLDIQNALKKNYNKVEIGKLLFSTNVKNPTQALNGLFKYKYIIDYFNYIEEKNIKVKFPDVIEMIINDYKAIVENYDYPKWVKSLL